MMNTEKMMANLSWAFSSSVSRQVSSRVAEKPGGSLRPAKTAFL